MSKIPSETIPYKSHLSGIIPYKSHLSGFVQDQSHLSGFVQDKSHLSGFVQDKSGQILTNPDKWSGLLPQDFARPGRQKDGARLRQTTSKIFAYIHCCVVTILSYNGLCRSYCQPWFPDRFFRVFLFCLRVLIPCHKTSLILFWFQRVPFRA